MKFIFCGMFCILANSAFAQQQPQILSAAQRCGQMVGQLVSSNAEMSERLDTVTLQAQSINGDLVKAKARIKELEDKYEPQKDGAK